MSDNEKDKPSLNVTDYVGDYPEGLQEKLRQHKLWAEEYHKWKRPNNLITLKEFDHE